jgi:hypothetical protein
MLKDQMTPGMLSPTGSLTMYVGPAQELYQLSCQMEIERNLQSILKTCGSCQGAVISTTQDAHTKRTTIAIYFEPRKILEKSGAT